MEVGGRLTFGGMEKAFSTNIMMRIVEYFAGRLIINLSGNAPLTSKQGRKRKKTCRRSGNRVWGEWEFLPNELLVSILMKLSIIDYLAFSGACRSWRSASIDIRKSYMERQQPLVVVRPKYAKRACVLYNMFDGKSYKAMLPHLPCRILVGLSCGYLITIDRNMGFWLVNLMTRHELHFPVLPRQLSSVETGWVRPVLFQSTRLSRVFMVLFYRKENWLLLCESGASSWQEYLLPNACAGISDVKIFDGKIFVLTCDARFGEFNPREDPFLRLYNTNIPIQLSSRMYLQLVTSDNKLCMIVTYRLQVDCPDVYLSLWELDHTKMECVKQIHDLGAKSLFMSPFSSALVDTTGWGAGNCVCVLRSPHSNRWSFFHLNGSRIAVAPVVWDSLLNPYSWYFPSESWDINCVGD